MNKSNRMQEALQKLPSVDEVLNQYSGNLSRTPHKLIVKTVRSVIQNYRNEILKGSYKLGSSELVFQRSQIELDKLCKSSLRSIINGTGIVLHTGLGRAPISKTLIQRSVDAIYPYTNIEIDVNSGKRGERNNHVSKLINSLTGAESSIVVNNCAASVILMLNSTSEGKNIIISRGQQVAIGGSYRIPDVIKKSNCKMVEVGTTNKTDIKDYESAINDETGAILVAHTSNFKVVGFTQEVELSELVSLSKRKRIPVLVDLGSGALADFSSLGIKVDSAVSYYIKKGVHAVAFSGDKLLGGPQSGIICGKKTTIKKMHQNAFYRALRCDKLKFSILENILRTYSSSKEISPENLTVYLLKRKRIDLERLGKSILMNIKKSYIQKYNIELVESEVEAGSGSLPTQKIPSMAITFSSKSLKPSQLSEMFRKGSIPIIGYIHGNKFRIDLKAIPDEFATVCSRILNEVLQ